MWVGVVTLCLIVAFTVISCIVHTSVSHSPNRPVHLIYKDSRRVALHIAVRRV